MKRQTALIGFLLLVLTGCSNSNASSSSETTTTPAPPTTSTSTTPPTTAAPAGVTATSTPVKANKSYLTGVTATRASGQDRIVFTFNEAVPGFSAEYITPPLRSDGSGDPVAISGSEVLRINFETAGTVDLTGGMKTYYDGPQKISPTDTATISEVVRVSEFEGYLLWGVGMKSRAPFNATSSDNTLTFIFS